MKVRKLSREQLKVAAQGTSRYAGHARARLAAGAERVRVVERRREVIYEGKHVRITAPLGMHAALVGVAQ